MTPLGQHLTLEKETARGCAAGAPPAAPTGADGHKDQALERNPTPRTSWDQ